MVFFLGLIVADTLTNYEPVKLSGLLVFVFWIPLLALHEAGHAVVAWLLGWRVSQVVIGMGPAIRQFRIGSAQIELRLWPLEGFVRSTPNNLSMPQLKNALIYLAGPGVELLLAAAILAVFGSGQLFSRSENHGLIACQSLAIAAVVQGVLNLIPHTIQTPAGNIPNDGLGIIYSLLAPTSVYARMIDPAPAEQGQKS